MNRIILFIFFGIYSNFSFSQYYEQYFEGVNNNLIINIAPDSNNIWEIGQPQKIIFNSAATIPNAICTKLDTIYPISNTSIFSFDFQINSDLIAIQWMQKIDSEFKKDGGIIEYSVDKGANWSNIFNNPYVYNLYGFDTTFVDTIYNGKKGFTGSDNSWRNVWLCFDGYYFNQYDTMRIKYTFYSDDLQTNQEGWVLDNFLIEPTWYHTLEEARKKQIELIRVYPTVSTGKVNIVIKRLVEEHFIESIKLIDLQGKVIQSFDKIPSRFFIDLSDSPNGKYFLQVNTNLIKKTFPLTLQK